MPFVQPEADGAGKFLSFMRASHSMNLRLQCQCGRLRGQLERTEHAVRGKCYCKDCRTYASYLDRLELTHDDAGGAEFIATSANNLVFDQGTDNLACLSLSDRGLLRWYAACCKAPIANTTRDWKFPYVGLFRNGLNSDSAAYERAFPKMQMHVNTRSAKTKPPGASLKTLIALSRFLPRVFAGRLNGSYRTTPFFVSPLGVPSAPVYILSNKERRDAGDA